MDFLEHIIARKKEEVAKRKQIVSVEELKESKYYSQERRSLKERFLSDKHSKLIAEIKRASPSKGILHPDLNIIEVAKGYEAAGVSAISILTDGEGFHGSLDDIREVRSLIDCPILRKDFMLDPYQLEEARSVGADIILLIASVLSPADTLSMASAAKDLGLEVLLEVHNEDEVNSHLASPLSTKIDFVGVNNRNLKTFEVNLDTSRYLVDKIGSDFFRISESGISDVPTILDLASIGYDGFLIGECFMKTDDPSGACKEMLSSLREKQSKDS